MGMSASKNSSNVMVLALRRRILVADLVEQRLSYLYITSSNGGVNERKQSWQVVMEIEGISFHLSRQRVIGRTNGTLSYLD